MFAFRKRHGFFDSETMRSAFIIPLERRIVSPLLEQVVWKHRKRERRHIRTPLAGVTGSLYTLRRSGPAQKFGFTVPIGWQRTNNAMNGVSLFHKCSPPCARIIPWSGFDERVAESKGLYSGTTEPAATAQQNCFQFLL